MRTYLILGTGVDGRGRWGAPPLPGLAWNIHDRPTTDSLVEEAAGIAGVNAWLVLLRGKHDTGFLSEALMASILAYRGPLPTGGFPALAPWIDTGAISSRARDANGKEVAFDFANDTHLETFCSEFLMPFWTRFPEGGRIRHERSKNGRRLITWWGIDSGGVGTPAVWPGQGIINQHLCQRLLDRISVHMVRAGLGEPDHIVDTTWLKHAPGLNVHAFHSWFTAAPPPNREGTGAYSISRHNGIVTGCACPGFQVKDYQPIVPRNDGATARAAFKAFRDAGCDYVLLEGHTDDIEDAGWYRSSAWSPPTLYLDIIREHIQMADPITQPEQVKVNGVQIDGKFAGIDPDHPEVIHADRATLGTWEAVTITRHPEGWSDVRFTLANRQLGVDRGVPVSLPAGDFRPIARFTANGTTLEPGKVVLELAEGFIVQPVTEPILEPISEPIPVPTRLPITQIAGVDFLDKNGKRRVLNGVDAFKAYRLFLDGGAAALKPFLEESKKLNFDMWRVFMTGSVAQNGFIGINPKEPGYYEKVRPFADELNAHGILLLACAYVDNQDVKAGIDHWKRLGDLLGGAYCLLSGGNEFPKNGWNPKELTAPASGVWWSRGSSTSNPDPFEPMPNGATFIEFHPTRSLPTMLYDTAASPTNLLFEKKLNLPLIIDEPIGFAEADVRDKRSGSPKMAWQLARIYSALCAGVVYHNDQSQRGLLMTGNILKCAEAWQEGMRI